MPPVLREIRHDRSRQKVPIRNATAINRKKTSASSLEELKTYRPK